MSQPAGFVGVTANLGLKEGADDFAVVAAPAGSVTSAAVFTRSRFAGASVLLSRASDVSAFRGVVTISKNANVATGATGEANAREVRRLAAEVVGVRPEELLVASTGVIGVQYPMEVITPAIEKLYGTAAEADFEAIATAIMTTDTIAKVETRTVGGATITGVAKGVGMIEPDMATMLTYFFTDAEVSAADLDAVFRRVVDRTYNAVSIDTDTSTSDTAAIFASGEAGPVDLAEFEAQLYDAALALVKKIASDGEGASTLIEVSVSGARDDAQAKRVGKAIVNSPLVKTAVHGADPNWGRIAMAIGKLHDETDIDPERVRIAFGGTEIYPVQVSEDLLADLSTYLSGDEVSIEVDLGIASGEFTVYGCDLTEGYIRINADYTT
ncbi:glutamate N-acetyltransferase/amino-acid N-acetyltransferase [Nocardioides luteus]|uniref:Arginine biosynthesis bifunctional protein ArgJ n=1 Tax=Nocardioides luteus TaxID=1844 RepID=A0ABQ5SYK3_9ACTN|nr:bifunctional glutamate N-acetyltransferase/amino-acid acetyltransferase ArgJ [Nocardioides luteus]MDR7312665.1 glutamate N-acetyltransferase/amino-acid N-acetyltransferase [Nocardioides luteus]GGR46697.1 arginine biosynthesis bifunctional protein ArgJ [Nocardioides luteus]GLJ68914.1 arginine biosynthesis bifunctional protein ArgJ [Nocardioides luteus]